MKIRKHGVSKRLGGYYVVISNNDTTKQFYIDAFIGALLVAAILAALLFL